MSSSILKDTKLALGLDAEYAPFDHDVMLHLNSVLSDLHQLGIGPPDGLSVSGVETQWTALMQDDPRLNNVKSYIYLRVRMLFDPPTLGYLITAMEKLIEKTEWRITIAQDEITRPPIEEEPAVNGGEV